MMQAKKVISTAKKRFGPGEWLAAGGAINHALGNVLTRVASVGGDPWAGSILRTIPIAIIGIVVMAFRPEQGAKLLPRNKYFLGWRAIKLLVFYCLVIAPVSLISFYMAIRYGGVLVAVPIFATNPLLSALIAIPFLGEAFNWRIGGGIILTIFGIVILTYGQHIGSPVSANWPLGVLFALVTSLSWAAAANLSRDLLPQGLDLFWLLGLTNGMGIIVMISILASVGRLDALGDFSLFHVGQLMLSGIFSGMGGLLLSAGFLYTSVASVTTIKSIDVAIATILAVAFLGESINVMIASGIVIILGGVLIVIAGKPEQAIA
jgi:drug/metabolite transporter (DMT)-like permease